MRILIHSNAEWVPTGYGRQTQLLIPELQSMGHTVAVSAFHGLSGAPIQYRGHLVYPGGQTNYGVDVLPAHAEHFRADLVITLMDFWKLAPAAEMLGRLRIAAWLPIDTTPLGQTWDHTLTRSGAYAIAMSEFGHRQLTAAGHHPTYIPHAVDTDTFQPPADRAALREALGLGEKFAIGICAANKDALRKAWPEQFRAFAEFAKRHDDAMLLVHALPNPYQGGLQLTELAEDLGITDRVIFSNPYDQVAGLNTPEYVAGWMGALDVLSNCSMAEGFGVPIIEAQACGTPVIVTDSSSMNELAGPGWVVGGDEWWNPVHRATWIRPRVPLIVEAYEAAYQDAAGIRNSAWNFAQKFDIRLVAEKYWKPFLTTIESDIRA